MPLSILKHSVGRQVPRHCFYNKGITCRGSIRTIDLSQYIFSSWCRQLSSLSLRSVGGGKTRLESKTHRSFPTVKETIGYRRYSHLLTIVTSEFRGEVTVKEVHERLLRRVSLNSFHRSLSTVSRKGGGKKFVSFFDEVDSKMDKKEKSPEIGNFSSLFNHLNEDSETISTREPIVGVVPSLKDQNQEIPRSIFDILPATEEKANPDFYDNDLFEQYVEMMKTQVVHNSKFVKRHTKKGVNNDIIQPVVDWLLKGKKSLKYDLSVLDEALTNGISSTTDLTEDTKKHSRTKHTRFRRDVSIPRSQSQLFHQQLQNQRDSFIVKTGFTREQYQIALGAFCYLSSSCARCASCAPLMIAWEKIKESGMILDAKIINTFLYVASTITKSGFLASNSSGTSIVSSILGDGIELNEEKEGRSSDMVVNFPSELAIFHDLLYEPTEKSFNVRVKHLVSKNDARGAEALLDSFPSNDNAKLRTFLPVLKLYCEEGNVNAALRLLNRMRSEPKVQLVPENYILVISTLAKNGCFSSSSERAVDTAEYLGYPEAFGPGLFNSLVSEMAEDSLEITSASARMLYNAIVEGFKDDKSCRNLEPIHSLSDMSSSDKPAEADELVVHRLVVGKTTGLCPITNVNLKLIKLVRDQREQLRKQLLQLSKSTFEEYSGYQHDTDYAVKELTLFTEWLDERKGEAFTAIVDGANVAYYMQNFENGSFNYHQIQFMIDALEKMGEKPLVVLPFKYCSPSFLLSMAGTQRRQVLSPKEQEILSNLVENGRLYRVPAKCLDDYYWMLASISDQTRSRNGANLDVSPNNDQGRWPGARPMIISNDLMRDHQLNRLEPRLFRRWISCYMVNYNFTAFIGNDRAGKEIVFSTADFFSREIQGNPTESGTACKLFENDVLEKKICC